MQALFLRNVAISFALLGFSAVLAILEVRVLSEPPSGIWFGVAIAAALVGFAWANSIAFPLLAPRALRMLAVGCMATSLWVAAILLAVVVGVNLKFVLGGHV